MIEGSEKELGKMARFSINEVKRINSSEYENSEFAIGKMGFL